MPKLRPALIIAIAINFVVFMTNVLTEGDEDLFDDHISITMLLMENHAFYNCRWTRAREERLFATSVEPKNLWRPK